MSNDLTTTQPNDGWNDAAKDAESRILRGTLLKFGDGRWSRGKEGEPVKDGTKLVATSTACGWVKWKDGKPAEYRMRQPGQDLPERDELGDLDEGDWETGPDGVTLRDPWQLTRFLHLVDPFTVESFTFSTSSIGGRNAVIDLADQIARMRCAHPGAVPVVELGTAPMTTRYGRKTRPFFKVVGWKATDGEIDAPAPRQIEDARVGAIDANRYAEVKGRASKPAILGDLDDAIPF